MEDFYQFMDGMNLPEEYKKEFIQQGKQVYLKRNEYFVKQGEFSRYAGVIRTGDFRYYRTGSDSKEHTLGFSFGFDFVSDYPTFLSKKPAEVSIQAISDCELLLYTCNQMLAFFEYNMDTQRFGRKIAERLMTSWEKLLFYFHCDTPEERYRKLQEQCPDLFQRVPLCHIASTIGVTPETVSRIRKKILETDRQVCSNHT